jgi:hypothetical protein
MKTSLMGQMATYLPGMSAPYHRRDKPMNIDRPSGGQGWLRKAVKNRGAKEK